jgi:hypothetical protein
LSLPWNSGNEDAAHSDDPDKRQEEGARAKPGFSLSVPFILSVVSPDPLSISYKIAGRSDRLLVQLSD